MSQKPRYRVKGNRCSYSIHCDVATMGIYVTKIEAMGDLSKSKLPPGYDPVEVVFAIVKYLNGEKRINDQVPPLSELRPSS